MAEPKQNKVSAVLRDYAIKVAAEKAASGEGAPDRMTVGGGDGEGGISTEKKSIPTDSGEADLKRDQPTDAKGNTSTGEPGGSPDRMTVGGGDGEGGISCAPGTIPTDSGEADLKNVQPADGTCRKSAADVSARVARIRAAVTAANPKVQVTKAASEEAPKAEKTTAAGEIPAPAEKAAGTDAPAPSLEYSQETLAKIASVILSTDEGITTAHNLLEKQAGEEAARAQIQDAIEAAQRIDQSEIIKAAAFDNVGDKFNTIMQSFGEHGVDEDASVAILKQASLHQAAINNLDHPLLKQAYAQGMDDGALMDAADEAVAGGEEGAPPVDEALPMGGEELGEEEIMQLLQEMIASGEITEEDVLAAVAATEGGGMEGGMEAGLEGGGMEAGLEGAAPPVPEEAPPAVPA